MTANLQPSPHGAKPGPAEAAEVARILSAALFASDGRGRARVQPEDLAEADLDRLCVVTLAYLYSQPASPSPMPGWGMVSARAAGVMPFWAAALGIVEDEARRVRLRSLRMHVYDRLEHEQLLVKEPGQGKPVHLPPRDAPSPTSEPPEGKGAGFGSPELNQLVEATAMTFVTAAYEADGWTVEDVTRRNVGWDVTCRRAGHERHLEIKGCSGARPSILLTANEYVVSQRDPDWVLAVATRALVAPALVEFSPVEVAQAARPSVFRVDLTKLPAPDGG